MELSTQHQVLQDPIYQYVQANKYLDSLQTDTSVINICYAGSSSTLLHHLTRASQNYQWQIQAFNEHDQLHKTILKKCYALIMLQADLWVNRDALLEGIKKIKKTTPKTKIIILSPDNDLFVDVLQAGADDCLHTHQSALLVATCKKLLARCRQKLERQELAKHYMHFQSHDQHATYLVRRLMPPEQQQLGHFHITCRAQTLATMTQFYLLDDKLLVLVLNSPVLDHSSAFGFLTLKILSDQLYRHFPSQESVLLKSPHKLLSYLNWYLCESGLKAWFNAQVFLINPSSQQVTCAQAGFIDENQGLPLGMMKQSTYQANKSTFRYNDTIGLTPHLLCDHLTINISYLG